MRGLAASLVLFIVACGSGSTSGSVAAKDYDRSCTSVADCTAVYVGVLSCCSQQPCPNAAIRLDKLATYMSDVSARMPAMCPSPVTPGTCRPPPQCQGRLNCSSGVCTLDEPPVDGATTD
jgi:hypothetical protein